jgi:hypothetical protein
VTRSLDRVDHRVGFQNYEYREIRNSCLLSMKKLFKIFFFRRTILLKTALFWFFLFFKKENVIGMNPKMSYEIYKKTLSRSSLTLLLPYVSEDFHIPFLYVPLRKRTHNAL